jgi:hypothetical protein
MDPNTNSRASARSPLGNNVCPWNITRPSNGIVRQQRITPESLRLQSIIEAQNESVSSV